MNELNELINPKWSRNKVFDELLRQIVTPIGATGWAFIDDIPTCTMPLYYEETKSGLALKSPSWHIST